MRLLRRAVGLTLGAATIACMTAAGESPAAISHFGSKPATQARSAATRASGSDRTVAVAGERLSRRRHHRRYYVHRVYHTCANGGCGLHVRTGPGYTRYASVGLLRDGDRVKVVCQAAGEAVSGLNGTSSDVWDRLANGRWVADYYVDTPGMEGVFSPPIPRCGAAAHAYVTTACNATSYKPTQLTLDCYPSPEPQQEYLRRIRWTKYGGSVARGRGTIDVESCLPSCAQGSHYRFRGRVLLRRPRYCPASGVNEYTEGVVTARRRGWRRGVRLDPYCGTKQLGTYHYTAQDGHNETLGAWQGGHVTVLAELGVSRHPGVMTRLVGALDRAWSYYAAATGRSPSTDRYTLNGRDMIAEVSSTNTPGSCGGAACSYIGSDGTEILTQYFEYGYNEIAQHDLYDQVAFYELGRAFWFWGDQLMFVQPNHDPVVTGFAVWMRFRSMAAAGVKGAPYSTTPFPTFYGQAASLAGHYEADPSLTFANTLAKAEAPGAYPCGSANCGGTDFWASLMMQLAARHGGDSFVSRFWRAASRERAVGSTAGAVTNWERAASKAACTNLASVFYTRWGFPRPDGSVTQRPPAGTVPEPRGHCGTG